MPSAVLPSTVPQVLPQREYASSFGGDTELELLLVCCARRQVQERIQHVLRPRMDWERVASLAERHGVIPHVYTAIAQADGVQLGEMSALRQKYNRSVHQALWLTRELLRILEHFEECGVEALPYKGPALAQILRGSVTSRQFADLDILVQPDDLPKVKATLAELGYEASLRLSAPEERAYIAGGYESAYHFGEHKNFLEIQWRVVPRFYAIDFDVEGFFERAVTIELCGRAVRTLCSKDLMLVLCVHAAKHAWTQLSWILEIAALSQSHALDWDVIWREAETLGICRIVAASFLLANRLFQVEPPGSVYDYAKRDAEVGNIVNRVLPFSSQTMQFNPESASYFRLMLDVRERWRDRARLLWRLAVSPSVGEWSAIRLPKWLFPLYRVVRFVRLTRRWLS